MTAIQVPGLLTFTIAILVFFTGVGLNHLIRPLQRWNIPEAVTGGLLAAVVTLLAHTIFSVEISFSLDARDMLLLYFSPVLDSMPSSAILSREADRSLCS
jgi:glutamate:Na+ symporter, ESS family